MSDELPETVSESVAAQAGAETVPVEAAAAIEHVPDEHAPAEAAAVAAAPDLALERRYRRLLALYPPSWRSARLEEVLTVLLSCAEPGRTRPGWRDGVDLMRHAFGERVRLAGRPPVSSDDRRCGVALAGVVAFALLAAVSVLQLIVLVPSRDAWTQYQFTTGPGSGAGVAMLASAAAVLAGGLWLAGARRSATVALALADICFLLAALQLRNGFLTVPWPLIVGILALAALSTVLVAHAGLSQAGRAMVGPRGALELVGALVLFALAAGWRYLAWSGFLFGPGNDGTSYHTIPEAALVALIVAAVAAIAVARRNPVPLIAVTVLSPLLLAGAVAAIAQSWLFGNAYVAVNLANDAVPAAIVVVLVGASALATRRRAVGLR